MEILRELDLATGRRSIPVPHRDEGVEAYLGPMPPCHLRYLNPATRSAEDKAHEAIAKLRAMRLTKAAKRCPRRNNQ